jgi:membrane peptidoglycan carboxypeptidase
VINMAKQFGVGDNPFNQDCSTGWDAKAMATCSDMTADEPGIHMGMASLFSTNRKFCDPGKNGTLCGSPQITFGATPLTPIEQASTFATLADDGLYHSPHVIKMVQQGSKVLKSDVQVRRVLSPAAAADVDYALSFDNNYSQGTADANVSFRRGGVIGKTGTLGTLSNVSQAWFVGATPDEYSMSVALYTELAGSSAEFLNGLPFANGVAGEDGGAWPATIWNQFMTTEFTDPQWEMVTQAFPPVNGAPFTTWILAKPAPPKKTCQFSFLHGLQNCQQCHGHHQQCVGTNNGNPNPTASQCPPLNPACGITQTASPGATSTPSPSPTPTPSPSISVAGTNGQAAEEASSALALVPQRGG